MQLYHGRWLAVPDDDGIAIRAENKQVIRQCLFEALTLILSIFSNKFSFERLRRAKKSEWIKKICLNNIKPSYAHLVKTSSCVHTKEVCNAFINMWVGVCDSFSFSLFVAWVRWVRGNFYLAGQWCLSMHFSHKHSIGNREKKIKFSYKNSEGYVFSFSVFISVFGLATFKLWAEYFVYTTYKTVERQLNRTNECKQEYLQRNILRVFECWVDLFSIKDTRFERYKVAFLLTEYTIVTVHFFSSAIFAFTHAYVSVVLPLGIFIHLSAKNQRATTLKKVSPTCYSHFLFKFMHALPLSWQKERMREREGDMKIIFQPTHNQLNRSVHTKKDDVKRKPAKTMISMAMMYVIWMSVVSEKLRMPFDKRILKSGCASSRSLQ